MGKYIFLHFIFNAKMLKYYIYFIVLFQNLFNFALNIRQFYLKCTEHEKFC